MVSESLSNLRWGSVHKLIRVASWHLVGPQEWGDPMRVANEDAVSQKGVIVTFHIVWVWEWVYAYMYIHIILDTTCFKAVMVMNLSELRS
jgi:hypothetical protein